MNDLEQLLSAPMTNIEDQGFSEEVVTKIAKFNRQRTWFLSLVFTFLSILFLIFYPVLTWLTSLKEFIFSYGFTLKDFTLKSLAINNDQLMAQLPQPILILTLLMIIIVIFTRIEN